MLFSLALAYVGMELVFEMISAQDKPKKAAVICQVKSPCAAQGLCYTYISFLYFPNI